MGKKKQYVRSANSTDPAVTGPAVLEGVNKLAQDYGLTGTLTTKERRHSTNTWFNPAFVEAVVARYDAQKALIGGDFDAAQMREDLSFVSSYEPAASAAKTLARAIEDQILQRKAEVALEANAIYAAMKGKAKTAKGAALRGDVAALAALRKQGPRKTKATTQPAPPAAPAPAVSEPSPEVAPAK